MNKLSMCSALSMLLLMFSLVACGGKVQETKEPVEKQNSETKATTTEPTAEGKEFTAKYQCPMHCPGSGNEVYGSCPVCGMRYMYNPNLPDAAEINKKLFKENPQIDPNDPKPAGGHEGHGH